MDASRSDLEFLYQLVAAAIEEGATTINIPDTVGYAMPSEFGALIRSIRETVPGADNVRFSVHCHNDLGMATANSLAGVRERRAPDRGHDQRHRRARGQHLPRGGDHGDHALAARASAASTAT